MAGTRSIYFTAEAEQLVLDFCKETDHKFSPAVCIIIKNAKITENKLKKDVANLTKAYNAQREANANLTERIRNIELKQIDPNFKETEQINKE